MERNPQIAELVAECRAERADLLRLIDRMSTGDLSVSFKKLTGEVVDATTDQIASLHQTVATLSKIIEGHENGNA